MIRHRVNLWRVILWCVNDTIRECCQKVVESLGKDSGFLSALSSVFLNLTLSPVSHADWSRYSETNFFLLNLQLQLCFSERLHSGVFELLLSLSKGLLQHAYYLIFPLCLWTNEQFISCFNREGADLSSKISKILFRFVLFKFYLKSSPVWMVIAQHHGCDYRFLTFEVSSWVTIAINFW